MEQGEPVVGIRENFDLGLKCFSCIVFSTNPLTLTLVALGCHYSISHNVRCSVVKFQ
jgi:hypothetical protein